MSDVLSQIDVSLSKEAREVLYIAGRKAEEYLHATYGAPHLLWALLNKKISTYKLIRKWGKDIFYMQEWASVRLEEYPKANGVVANADADSGVQKILMEADQLRFELNRKEVDAIGLLAILCTSGLAFSFDQLKTLPLSKEEILDNINGRVPSADTDDQQPITRLVAGTASNSLVSTYCLDKQKEFADRERFHLVEREKEISTCLEILSRYSKANLIIKGEPGVGKTALIGGLAEQIEKGKVPDNLRKARLLELDLAALQAGISYKGELEDRFQKILRELGEKEKPILVIEEIHSFLDKDQNFSSLPALLIMELDRGNIAVIGTTSRDYFRKNIEKNERFIRRFETLALEEPDGDASAHIIRTVVSPHEDHHSLQITDDNIREAIRLAKRYDKDRHLPDAAIDLIDRCMARLRITIDRSETVFEELKDAFREYQKKQETADVSILRECYGLFYKIAGRLMNHHQGLTVEEEEALNADDDFLAYLEEILPRLNEFFENPSTEIKRADLAEIISGKTGIPTGKIQAREKKRLLGMKKVLRERVVGQDAALQSVSEAVLESRSGLLKEGQPVGSFFFLGPTGTGKTELAKALSEFLFQDQQAMIRFDMSEFKEKHSAALLHGAPPGYVGYEEGGVLVNKIREQPYSVVLFDEIEKAHASVFDVFLQILDEGKLSDRLGKQGDFSNAVILFTSNIGSERITAVFKEESRLPSGQELLEILSNYFRPEFLGRLTEIVPFAPISEEVLPRIFEINLSELVEAAERKGISVKIDSETKAYLTRSGYSSEYGARPLKGVIRDKIRRPLSRMIIEGRVNRGAKVRLSLDNNHQLQWNIN